MDNMPNRRIKVMQVTRSLSFGGLEKLVASLAMQADPARFEMSVCCLLRKGVFAEKLEQNGIVVHLLEDNPDNHGSRTLFFKLAKLLRKERPDILHTHNTHAFMDGTLASLLSRIPAKIHTDHARSFPDSRHYMIAENLCSRVFDRVIAVSNHSKSQLVHYEGIKPSKIDVIYNGVNFDTTLATGLSVREELGITPATPLIGTISRLTAQKGTRYLLEAIPAIVEQCPRAEFLIVGDGDQREKLEQQSRSLGIDRIIHFVGYQKAVDRYIEALDLFAMPSIWEGMPLGLLEVLSMGKPVVATSVGGIPEVIVDQETGYLVPPENASTLANTIIQAIGNPSLKTMATAGQERYKQYFQERVMVANYENLYETLISPSI